MMSSQYHRHTYDKGGCNIRGDIPLEFKVFSEADTIDLSNNGFTGEIVGEIFEQFERLGKFEVSSTITFLIYEPFNTSSKHPLGCNQRKTTFILN